MDKLLIYTNYLVIVSLELVKTRLYQSNVTSFTKRWGMKNYCKLKMYLSICIMHVTTDYVIGQIFILM